MAWLGRGAGGLPSRHELRIGCQGDLIAARRLVAKADPTTGNKGYRLSGTVQHEGYPNTVSGRTDGRHSQRQIEGQCMDLSQERAPINEILKDGRQIYEMRSCKRPLKHPIPLDAIDQTNRPPNFCRAFRQEELAPVWWLERSTTTWVRQRGSLLWTRSTFC
jgi:hypothetical protein